MAQQPRIQAVAFDAFGTLFDVYSVGLLAEQLFPGKGAALAELWRQKQIEYSFIRSLSGRYKPFWDLTRDGLDFAAARLVRRVDGSWLVDGSVSIERLKLALEIVDALPGEDEKAYNTLGGLVMYVLGRIPGVADRFELVEHRFEIVDMDKNRVDKVLVTSLVNDAQASANAPDKE